MIVTIKDTTAPPPDARGAGFWFTTDLIPGYVNRNWVSETPYQFSYYYIYDNNEESRLAPWSKVLFFKRNIELLPGLGEIQDYCDPAKKTIVKFIVFVLRSGNTGTVYNIKKFNVSEISIPTATNPIQKLPILNIQSLDEIDKNPTPASIYDQRYDSVPLLSATNEIAANILNHGNVVTDYGDFGSIKISSAIATKVNNAAELLQQYTPAETRQGIFKTFRPDSTYTVGIQLIDEYGRCSPVLNPTAVKIPAPFVNAITGIGDGFASGSNFNVYYNNIFTPETLNYNQDLSNNQYEITINLEGQLPNWAKYIRIACTKNNTVNFFNKTISRRYLWYQAKDGENIVVRSDLYTNNFAAYNGLSQLKDSNNPDVLYTFKGYGVELSSDVPFLFDAAEEQYLKLGREYYETNDPIPNTGITAESIEYKIVGQTGAILLIEEDIKNVKFYTGYQSFNNSTTGSLLANTYPIYPLWYQVELYTKKKVQETIFYDTNITVYRNEYLNTNSITVNIQGDCYMSYFRKTFTGQTATPFRIIKSFGYQNNNPELVVTGFSLGKNDMPVDGGYTVSGFFYSMNLTNIYNENWQSDLGLENIVQGPNYQQSILKTSIAFSNKFIKGTSINGLNKFNPLDLRQAPAENGPLTALVVTNATQQEPGVMLAIGSLGVSSFYYTAVQLVNVDGASNLATTDQHLASQRPLLGQFGTSQPASITKNTLSTVYWWSDVVNDFIRYTNAGLEKLGLTYSFGNKLREKAINKKVVTAYDQIMDEAILVPQNEESFVFSERFKTFQGYRSYSNRFGQTPERIVGMASKTYFFLNGFAFVSKTTSPFNYFFGRTVEPELTIVTNEMPSTIKQWNAIKVFGPKPSSVKLRVGEAEGFYLETEIKPTWWIKRKGDYDVSIRRAIAQNGDDGLAGKVMESRILYSTFVFDANNFDKLNFIEIKSNGAIVQ
jgi:hypothetical protein